MTDLRKAAEQALEALENPGFAKAKGVKDAIQALRQALAERKTLAELLAATPVDETAKAEQEPAVTWDASAPLVLDCPRCGHCCQQRTWVGFTEGEKKYLKALGYVGIDDIEERLKRMNT